MTSFLCVQDHATSRYSSNNVPILLSNASGKHVIVSFLLSFISNLPSSVTFLSSASCTPLIVEKYHGELVLISDNNVTNCSSFSARSFSSLSLRYDQAELYL